MVALDTGLSRFPYELLGGYRESAIGRALLGANVPSEERLSMLAVLDGKGPSVRGWLDDWTQATPTRGDRHDNQQIREVCEPFLGQTGVDKLLKTLQFRQNVATALSAGATLLTAGIMAACL